MRRRVVLVVAAVVGTLVVGSGVALAATITCGTTNPCLGTNDPDTITGNNNYNEVYAGAGNDYVRAFSGSDAVFGDEGNDIIDGYAGQDVIRGGPDGDGSALGARFNETNLEGGEDGDTVYGGGGSDWIDAAYADMPSEFPDTPPVDESFGGPGNDHIYAVDGNMDMIDCGGGLRDVVYFDKGLDTIQNCEVKHRYS